MAKRGKTGKLKTSNFLLNKHKINPVEKYLIFGILVVVVLIIVLLFNMNWFEKTSDDGTEQALVGEDQALVGKAFSYTGCEKLPCLIKAKEDTFYGFSYKDVLYKFRVKELDAANEKIKYEIALMETKEEEGVADIFIDHMKVVKVEEPYIYFEFTLKNKGKKDVYDTFPVKVDVLDKNGDMWKSTYKNVEGIDQDESIIVELSVKFDVTYFYTDNKIPFVVYADPANIIKESDETNNVDDDVYTD
ncbi:hypothetical protein J4434_04900 [Candidatus Woesearchaeota archaeon]|nr:hypothetical protein [Candidatus Woesearchaeota archaeon]